MRLLEFGRDTGGANPRRTSAVADPAPAAAPATRNGNRPAEHISKPDRHLFPIEGNNAIKPARRSPVDLEALQSRIHALEQRILHQTSRIERRTKIADLDKLQLRMQRLEQTLNSELWAARQREHTMLEMLSKPPLKTAVNKRIKHLWQSDIPAVRERIRHLWQSDIPAVRERIRHLWQSDIRAVMCWLQGAAQLWWLDYQPCWWPRFAAAWQESLDQARR